MSIESIPDPAAADFYSDFKNVQIDPFIRNVFRKIKEYKELIAGEYLSSAEINKTMTDIDDEWRMLMGHEASFTGLASFLPVDAAGTDGVMERQFYENETFGFNGVMPEQLDATYRYNPETDEYEEHHTYNLRIQVFREALDSAGKIVHLAGVAEVDDVIALEFGDSLSLDGARTWLSYYHADDIDYIDVDLLTEGKEECEVALRLAGHSVDIAGPHRGDERMALRSMIALNIYTNSLISFDSSAPYLIRISGDAWFPTSGGMMEPGYAGGKQMAAIDKVSWLQPVGEERLIVTPHLHARLLNETKDMPDTHILIPVSAIEEFRSYRFDYYRGYDTDPGKS